VEVKERAVEEEKAMARLLADQGRLARKRRPVDLPEAGADEARAEEEDADPHNHHLPVNPVFLATFPSNP
jgi:hypothetical protein